jgi:hypothetical protein
MINSNFPPFLPCRGLESGHLQTLVATYLKPRLPYRAARHIVTLDDADAIVLHDDRPNNWTRGDRVVLMLHGVAGCHGSPYLVRTAHKLNRVGLRTFRMDLRGMGAGRALAEKPGHAGRSSDARAALQQVTDQCPDSPITLVGYSMGGNIVLKLLGELAEQTPPALDNAIAVAPPIDLLLCAQNLNCGLQRFYSRALTRMLVRAVRDRQSMLTALPVPLTAMPTLLWDFDDRITAPLSGYDGAESYYVDCSSARALDQIAIPTLIISAADDPLIPVKMFHQATRADGVHLHLTDHGGHLGFYGRRGRDSDRWWLDWRIVDWIQGR